MGNDFQNMGRFSKLPYLDMKLGHWPKFQMLHIISLSTSDVQNWAYFRSTDSSFRDTVRFSKMPYLGVKHVMQLALILSFYPRGSKLSLFWFYRLRFPRYRTIFKIAQFGHETWPLANSRSCTYTVLLLRGVEIDLMFALWAGVSEILADLQNCHIWAWNLVTDKINNLNI